MVEEIVRILDETLQLGDRKSSFNKETLLLGSLPEFDSMTVVTILTLMEERFGFSIEDDEISADIFESVGSLTAYAEAKLAE
jgi:acyl carrier protein